MLWRILPAAGIAVVIAVSAAGCANPIQGVLEDTVRKVAAEPESEDSGDSTAVAVNEAEIPEDFPDFVPLPDAAPVRSARFVQDGVVNWMLHYQGAWDSSTVDGLGEELLALGFTEEANNALYGAMHVALYTRDDLTVSLGLLGEDEGDRILQYMVLSQKEGT